MAFGNTAAKGTPDLQESLAIHANKYVKSCHNLLSVIIFTLINIFLLVTNSNSYFLFSAALPRLLIDLGMYLCGKYPADYYEGNLADYSFFGDGFFALMIAGAVLILGLYLLCWFLAKKQKVAWLIVGLAMFVIDTFAFFYSYGFSSDMIIDLVFRLWIGISLIQGISSFFTFKKLSAELAAMPKEDDTVTPEVLATEAAVTEEPVTEETVDTSATEE